MKTIAYHQPTDAEKGLKQWPPTSNLLSSSLLSEMSCGMEYRIIGS